MGVTAHHLDNAFAAIDARAGGLEAYLASLGAGDARLSRLCGKLLV